MSIEVHRDAIPPTIWDGFVTEHPHGSLFHLEEWGELVAAVYGLTATRLTAHRGATLVGGVTLFQALGPLGDRHLTTLPFSAHHHALLAEDECVAAALVAACRREVSQRRCRFVELKEAAPLSGISAPSPVFGNYWLPLVSGVESAWQGVEGPVRTKIRRAREAGLAVHWLGAEALSEFYGVYAATMRRLGAPPHSRRLFEAVLARFPCAASVAVVRHGGEAVAAAIVMHWRDWMGLPWAASRTEAFSLRPNNLLFWSIIERACAEGRVALDLGRSPLGSGPAHFKRGWGAKERPLHYVRLRPDGRTMPPLNPASATLRTASALWRRLPPWLATRWGPWIARRLP